MRRLRAAIAGQEASAPAPPATRLSVDRYLDPAQLAAERATLFRNYPLILAHASQLAEPGAFVTELIGDVPVLVLRDAAGEVRAFVNACRHRGALLVDEPWGCRKALTCRYHAWSYDLAGELLHVPHEDAFGGAIDHAERRLVQLPCEVRHGFVWVRLGGDGPLDVASALGPELDDDLAAFELDRHTAPRTTQHVRAANWKLVMDAFAEGLRGYTYFERE